MKPEPYKNRTVEYFPYFIFSPNGTVEGELVYINRGLKDDIDYLRRLNISIRGKIVIARGIFAKVIYKQSAFIFWPVTKEHEFLTPVGIIAHSKQKS